MEIPRWLLITTSVAVVGGIVGSVVWFARSNHHDRLLVKTGSPPGLLLLAALQRYTESRDNPKAGLGRLELFPSWAEPRHAKREEQLAESEAAAEAYDRNAEFYDVSPYPRRAWIFGSGGLYGLIPANALAPWRNSNALKQGRVTPYDVFDPWRATVCFVDYVWRLTQRPEFQALPAESQHWLAIKRGLASPSLMADHEEIKPRSRIVRLRATEAAKALMISEDVLYARVPTDWPKYPGATELVP